METKRASPPRQFAACVRGENEDKYAHKQRERARNVLRQILVFLLAPGLARSRTSGVVGNQRASALHTICVCIAFCAVSYFCGTWIHTQNQMCVCVCVCVWYTDTHAKLNRTQSLAHACFLARAHIQVRAVHAGGAGAADGTHASNSGSSLTHWPSHLWRYRLRGADSDSDGFGCEQGGRGGGGSSGVCWGTHGGGGWRRGDSVPASPSCCIYHICAPHSKEGGVFVRAFVHDCLGVHRGSVSG